MSAFIVGDETINRILAWLRSTTRGRYENLWYTETIAVAAGLQDLDCNSTEYYEKLGASMAMLNADAVDQRYDETNEPAFSYRLMCVNEIQALKSMRCWLYQCSEGDVPDRALYKAFQEVSLHLALHIVERMDAYDKAAWA